MGILSLLRTFGRRRVLRRPTGALATISGAIAKRKAGGTTTITVVKPTTTSVLVTDFTTGESKTVTRTTTPTGTVTETIKREGAKPIADVVLSSSERQAFSKSSAGQSLSSFERNKLKTGMQKLDRVGNLTGLSRDEVLRSSVFGNQLLVQERIPGEPVQVVLPPGRKEFTIAKDIGGGLIQDVHVVVVNGIVVSEEPRGSAIPITQRFIDSGRVGKTTREIVIEKLGKPVEPPVRVTKRRAVQFQERLARERRKLRAEEFEARRKARAEPEVKLFTKGQIKRIGKQVELGIITAVSTAVGDIDAIVRAPKIIRDIIKEKRTKEVVKELPSILLKAGREEIQLLRISPIETIAKVGETVLLFKGAGKALKLVGKFGKKVSKGVTTVLKTTKKSTKVVFIGTQAMKDGKIFTNVVFKTAKKGGGIARGVSVVKGAKVTTLTGGRAGKIAKEITKIRRIKRPRTFAGLEVGVVRRGRVRRVTDIRNVGVATSNLEALLQATVGQVAFARGKKLLSTVARFPTAVLKKKKARGLTIRKFASISASFTRKDLTLILGKTITNKKDLVKFIGIIKGTTKVGTKTFRLTKGQQQVFKRALSSVIATATASTKRSARILPKLSPTGKRAVLDLASATGTSISKLRVITKEPVVTAVTKRVTITKPKVITLAKTKQLTKQRSQVKTKIAQVESQSQKLRQRLKQVQRQKVTQKQRQRLIQTQRQIQKQKSRLKLLTRQLLIAQRRLGVRVPRIPKPKPIIPVARIVTKKIRPLKKKKIRKGWTAEIKRKGRWIRIKTFKTKTLALSKGKKRAKNTLSASIRIRNPKGKIVRLKPNTQFRRSKVDPRVLVQRKRKVGGVGSRLGTRAETKALARARRRKTMKRRKR